MLHCLPRLTALSLAMGAAAFATAPVSGGGTDGTPPGFSADTLTAARLIGAALR